MIRVIGLGNLRRRDDFAGIAVARRLEGRSPTGVEVLAWEGDPSGLLDRWTSGDRVIFADASSAEGRPGTIRRFDAVAEALPSDLFPLSSHALGLDGVIELARALGRLPRLLVVYAIEGADFSTGEGLTPAVERATAQVAARILAELEGSIGPGSTSEGGG